MKNNSATCVCHISTAHTARDIRIFQKECKSLFNAGYEVHYVVSHPSAEVIDGVRIVPLPATKSRFRRIFIHTWIAFFKANRTGASIYHFHDPEFLPAALMLRLLGKRVVYDAHEHLSKDILDKPWIHPQFVRNAVSSIVGIFEKISASLLSGVVAATSHIAEQFNPTSTVTVRNFPILHFLNSIPASASLQQGKKTLIYAGALTRIRGIFQLVESMSYLSDDVELLLAGAWEDVSFEVECKSSKGWSGCVYAGLLPQNETYAIMKASSAGMLTFLPAANHFEAMPNKAFEYLACGLPIVLSDFPYWRELFGPQAVYVNPLEPASIASGISKVLGGEFERGRTGGNTPVLSWENEESALLDFYTKILSN